MTGPGGPRRQTADSIVVVRLWREAHDPRARATVLANTASPAGTGARTETLVGVEAILAAVRTRILEFEARPATGR